MRSGDPVMVEFPSGAREEGTFLHWVAREGKGKLAEVILSETGFTALVHPHHIRSTPQLKYQQACKVANEAYKRYLEDVSDEHSRAYWEAREREATTLRERESHAEVTCGLCGTHYPLDQISIHHKDGNPYNNKIKNLLTVCHNCNAKRERKTNLSASVSIAKEDLH